MPNSFDTNSYSPSTRKLFVLGIGFVLIAALIAAACIAKSEGNFDRIVRVTAELVNVGDGLPDKSDVKFRGVLVGDVSDVELTGNGRPNIVHIDLKPGYVNEIPSTVTARVVPSNVFAVSSIQLIDNGTASSPLRAGAVIAEDTSNATVLFQSLLSKVRLLLTSAVRDPNDRTIGVLAAITQGTQGRGDQIEAAGHDLNEIVTQLNTVVGDNDAPSTVSALTDATAALRHAAPDLYDALDEAIPPMRTFAEKRTDLTDFLSAGLHTVGGLADAFDHQTDRLITITTELAPVVGVLGTNAGQFPPIFTRIQRLADRFNSALDRDTNLFTVKVVISLTPTRQYVRADCPRYGALEGPSCRTAPEIPTAPALYPALGSMGYPPPPPGVAENRPNFAPPRDSTRHAGEVPGGPGNAPLPGPVSEQPAPAPPPASLPLPAESGSPGPPGDVQPQSAVIGGTVGPVGSEQEKAQLSQIVGGQANAATQLLLGPVVRGSTVSVAPDPGGDR
jgi:virulence factor Mce-like protein